MKKWLSGMVVGSLILSVGIGTSWARKREPSGAEQRLQAELRAKKALNGTKWSIGLIPMEAESSASAVKDVLQFEKGKISSENLVAEGYSKSNFSVSLKGPAIVWETMQTKPDKSVVFWRGELRGETMRGVLSKRPRGKGKAENFNFFGQRIPSPAGETEAVAGSPSVEGTSGGAAAAVLSLPPEETQQKQKTQEKPKKKKKGWFW